MSIWPVILAAISSVLIGALWYHPRLFGTMWMQETGVTPERAERGARYKHVHFLLGFLAACITAYVLRELMMHVGIKTMTQAIGFAIVVWIGLMAPVSASAFLWEHRSFGFYMVNISYWLLVSVVMCTILAV
ncbi:DUF1761 domain-containing protein [Candidatus Parcubacteria bacterium]|nr:MAG: DUF1761 domain-containing protein [Candidatus Parcubacteria bacterium]